MRFNISHTGLSPVLPILTPILKSEEYPPLTMHNSSTPLSPREEDALERLESHYETIQDNRVTRQMAVDHLTSSGFESADAHNCVQQLILKGYLYEVDEELRILPRT